MIPEHSFIEPRGVSKRARHELAPRLISEEQEAMLNRAFDEVSDQSRRRLVVSEDSTGKLDRQK